LLYSVPDVPYRRLTQALQGICSVRAVTLSCWQLCSADKIYRFFFLFPQLVVIGPGTVCSNLCGLVFK